MLPRTLPRLDLLSLSQMVPTPGLSTQGGAWADLTLLQESLGGGLGSLSDKGFKIYQG